MAIDHYFLVHVHDLVITFAHYHDLGLGLVHGLIHDFVHDLIHGLVHGLGHDLVHDLVLQYNVQFLDVD